MKMKQRLFFLSLMALTLLKAPENVIAAENLPEAPPFILVKSKFERPLGSSYAVPYTNGKYIFGKKINKTKCVDRKRQVLRHREGLELDIPTIKEIRNTNYEFFNFRSLESSSKVSTKQNGGVDLPKDIGKFMCKFHGTSVDASNEITLDLFAFFSPYLVSVDPKATMFRELKLFKKYENSPFCYKCIYAEDEDEDTVYDCSDKDNTYLPASVDAQQFLGMCGTHVIKEHYHGVAYRRSIKFVFNSAKEKNEFASKISADLKNLSPETVATLASKIETEFKSRNSYFQITGIQTNYTKFLSFLEEQGYDDLVSEFEEKQSSLMMAKEIDDVITAAYDLHNVLTRINAVAGKFDYNDKRFNELFPVIAVSPDTHDSACSKTFLDLQDALGFAWNKITGQQSLAEKKEKAKKL